MSQGLGMKVSWLVELMLAGVGQRGSGDLKYHWFETIYGLIREQPWPWNWNVIRGRTYAPVTSVETYTWTAGTDYIQASALPTFDWLSTGRMVVIDNLPYTLLRVDVVLNRLWLDAPVVTTQTAPTLLTFYRGDFTLRTSTIESVEVDGTRVRSSTQDFWRRAGGQQHIGYEGSVPTEYEVAEEKDIPAPLYPPYVNGAAGAGNIGAGTYIYFWTIEDAESGRISRPGPTIAVTHAASVSQSIGYNRPSPDLNTLEGYSYQMVLWRSKVGATGERFPAWRVGNKIPYDAANFVVDNQSDQMIIQQGRYYDGPQVDIKWHLWPDAIYSVYARHVANYGGRPDPDDMVSLGKNNIVTDMLPLGASTFIELGNRGVQEQHTAIVKFRQQMAYLLRASAKANTADPGLEDININDGIPNSESYDPWDPTGTYTFKF